MLLPLDLGRPAYYRPRSQAGTPHSPFPPGAVPVDVTEAFEAAGAIVTRAAGSGTFWVQTGREAEEARADLRAHYNRFDTIEEAKRG